MNKVTTDFAMGIADKDLSEELQVKSEQLWEVECKYLASHRSTGAHWEQTGAFRAESETHPGVAQAGRTAENGVVQKCGTNSAEPVRACVYRWGEAWVGNKG